MTQPADGQPGQIPQQYQPAPAPLFPAATAEAVPWAKQAAHKEPATTRSRRLVRDLPSWDPLPPGEVIVNRHRRD